MLKEKNNILVASLYHDINCSSFGHAVEWAINRYTPYHHEMKTKWLKNKVKFVDINKPLFIEQNGIHRFNFETRYNLSFDDIDDLINGTNSCMINSAGIDLDNIDNVYRMGHYLGILGDDKKIPILLTENLMLSDDNMNFVIKEEYKYLVDHWYKLRAKIYKMFIYSKESLSNSNSNISIIVLVI